MYRFLMFSIWLCCGTLVADEISWQQIPNSKSKVVAGTIQLPAEGLWRTQKVESKEANEFYLIPSVDVSRKQFGKRMHAAMRDKNINQSRWLVRSPFRAIREYAIDHNGVGPKTIDDLDPKYDYVKRGLQNAPRFDFDYDGKYERRKIEGPFVFIVPHAKFNFNHQDTANRRTMSVNSENREVLAVELRPYVTDGKHWVLYTDGNCIRTEFEKDIIEKYKLKIRPIINEEAIAELRKQPTLAYSAVAVIKSDVATITAQLENPVTGGEHKLNWDIRSAKPKSFDQQLQRAREVAWTPYIQSGPAPVLKAWLRNNQANNNNRRTGRELSMFAVMGGRAAIEETLQLQNLDLVKGNKIEVVPLNSIKGVTVKGHPYSEMLKGDPGGSLQLADYVAPDRFFLYVAKPEAVFPFLDRGASFIAASGAGMTGNRLDYGLTKSYLSRMGIDRKTLESLLRSGLVKDLAISLPDLFVIDGTDITATIRLNQPGFVTGFLKILGLSLDGADITQMKTPDGRPSYWAFRGNLLCVSTNRAELQRTIDLVDQNGEGSLGKSAEFRYMLTQLNVEPETRFFAYFSDPFVRRLVGPEVKIGQLRRMKAKVAMEYLNSMRLLAQLDGVQDTSVHGLLSAGYLPKSFPQDDIELDDEGVPHSGSYGRSTKLKSLPDVPFDEVTKDEADAYDRYRDNYSQYWRQFFDPIAIRLNDTNNDTLELTTFILPLIDSSVYNQIRSVIYGHGENVDLRVPQIEPKPIVQFSLNLREQSWHGIAGNFSDFFRQYSGVSSAILDDLGPAVHVSIFDADPIIALGSGDVLGAFGGNSLRMGNNEMLMIPIALSVLTRPTSIYVETKDPERTAKFLRHAAAARIWTNFNEPGFGVSFYQEEGKDAWVWTMDIFGVVKLRYGVEVNNNYLVIRNIPWSTQDKIVDVAQTELASAQLSIYPEACKLQLPGLFATAADQERRANMAGIGRLTPFVILNDGDIHAAVQKHQQLFGFKPVHAGKGTWQIRNGQLRSSSYGSATRQIQPTFDPNQPFGLMQDIESLKLNMQFEDAGLRSIITWKLKD